MHIFDLQGEVWRLAEFQRPNGKARFPRTHKKYLLSGYSINLRLPVLLQMWICAYYSANCRYSPLSICVKENTKEQQRCNLLFRSLSITPSFKTYNFQTWKMTGKKILDLLLLSHSLTNTRACWTLSVNGKHVVVRECAAVQCSSVLENRQSHTHLPPNEQRQLPRGNSPSHSGFTLLQVRSVKCQMPYFNIRVLSI